MDLKSLKKTRASLKSKLTIFKNFLESLLPSKELNKLQIHELQLRLDKIQEMYNDFDSTQSEIENLCEIPDDEFNEREAFESSYFKTVATAQELLSGASRAAALGDGSSVTGSGGNTAIPELLLGTLRTHQKAACDEEMVTLICPRGTTISIQVAQYGASASQGSCASELAEYQPVAVEVVGDTSCSWPSALQYSLLQTVVEACQKKRQCKFHTSPKAFGVDPCPGSRRFVEVAYKCRPYEFRSKVGCENDVLHLSCNPHSRVAIYSAQYGRTEYDSIQCPQPRGMKEETCLEPYATETAMRECHGKRRCVLSADSNMFGKPCRTGSRTYLKVVYTCVPRTVLKERYESAPEEDEVAHDVPDVEHDDVDDSGDRWWGESAVPPAPAVAAVPPQRPSMSTSINATSIVRDTASASPPRHHLAKDDQFDMMYVYIIAAVAVSLLLCIVVGVVRCVVNKRGNEQPKGPDVSATTEIPNGFNDSISEVDNDINITSLSGPVDTVDSGLKPEMHFTNVALSPKINRYVGRPVPNTYPHVSTNMYGQVAEFPIEMPLRTMPHGTLGRGVAVKTLPRVQVQNETDPNSRSLYRYSNAQYYFG